MDGQVRSAIGTVRGRWRRPGVMVPVALLTLAAVWTLHSTVWVSMPLVAAFFLAIGVWPVCRWVQLRVPARLGWLGPAAALALLLLLLGVFFGSLWFVAAEVADDYQRFAKAIGRLRADAEAWFGAASAPLSGAPSSGAPSPAGDGQDALTGVALGIVSGLWQGISIIVLILFLTLLMLVEAPVWGRKLAETNGDGRRRALLKSLDLVADRFRKFVLVSSLLGLITGALYIGWLSLFGIDLVLLWGLLAFLLNYLPMVGSVVAGLLPVLMALVQKDPGTAAVVAGGLLVIEQVMGNTVAPLLQGKQLSVSPLVIMASLLVMSWMWGMAGAILATPVTVLLTIVFHEVPELRPAALFLSDQPDLEGLDEQLRS